MTMSAEDDGWFWGNRRGGGGAPLKDKHGSVITNLRLASKGVIEVDYSNVNGRERSGLNDSYSAVPSPSNGSTKKFMSALRDMTSNQSERDEKMRKDLAYKTMLRDQIEENRRRKGNDAEPDNPRYKLQNQKEQQLFQVPESMHSSNQYINANNNNNPSQFQNLNGITHPLSNNNFYPPQQVSNLYQARSHPAAGHSGPKLNNSNGAYNLEPSPHHYQENLNAPHSFPTSGYDNISNRRSHEKINVESQQQRPGDINTSDTAQDGSVLVPAKEFEELTQLCDRMKQEQETLRREVHEQAMYIKNLANTQKSGSRRSMLPTSSMSTGNSVESRCHSHPRSKSELRGTNGGRCTIKETFAKPGAGFGSSSTRNVISYVRQQRDDKNGPPQSPRSAPLEKQRQYEKFASRGLSQALKGPQRVGPAGIATALRMKNSQTKGATGAEYNITAKLRAAATSSTNVNRRSTSTGRLELNGQTPQTGESNRDNSSGGIGTTRLNGFQKLSLSLTSHGKQQPVVRTHREDPRQVGYGMRQNSNNQYDFRDNINTNRDELIGESRYIQMK